MSLYNQLPIRLEADLISSPPVTPVDANTGLPIQFWARQGLSIQCAVFDAVGNCVDLSNLSYAQLVIQQAPDSFTTSVVKTVLSGSIIPVITRGVWNAGTAAQVTFVLSAAETDLSLGGANSAAYWLQFQGFTTGGAPIVYAAGYITVFNPGSSLPPPGPNPYVSYHAVGNGSGNTVITPATQLHTEAIAISGGARTSSIIVTAAGLAAGARVGLRFGLPATTGINLQVYDQTLTGALLTTIVSDGSGFTPAAKVNLYFDGTNFQRDELIIPAFGQQT